MFRSGFIVTNHWKEQVGVRLLVCDEHGDKKVASSLLMVKWCPQTDIPFHCLLFSSLLKKYR